MRYEGYGTCGCGCGRQELQHVLHLTSGLAWECFRDGKLVHLREAEVAHRGGVVNVKLAGKAKQRKPGQSRGNPVTIRANALAKASARRRLSHLHPTEYELLLADERHRRGLPPKPLRLPAGAFVDAVETARQGVVYPVEVDHGEANGSAHHEAS